MILKQYCNKKTYFYSNSLFEKEKAKIFLKFVKDNPKAIYIYLNFLNFNFIISDLREKPNAYKLKKKKNKLNFRRFDINEKLFKKNFSFFIKSGLYLLKKQVQNKYLKKNNSKLILLKKEILKKKIIRVLYFSKIFKTYFYRFKEISTLNFLFLKNLLKVELFSLKSLVEFKYKVRCILPLYASLQKTQMNFISKEKARLGIRRKMRSYFHRKHSFRSNNFRILNVKFFKR